MVLLFHTLSTLMENVGGSVFPGVCASLMQLAYLSKMSWLDVAVAPSKPSAALPTAAAAPLPASMILTHCNEQPAREAEREGERGRGREGGKGEDVKR